MRLKPILGLLFFGLCLPVFAGNTNDSAFFQVGISGPYGMIGVLFSHYYPENIITNKSIYSVISVADGTSYPVYDVFTLGSGTNLNGTNLFNAIAIRGTFNEGVTNQVTISPAAQTPLKVMVNPFQLQLNSTNLTNTNLPPWVKYIWNNGQFGVLPFTANGNGGLGLQYTFSIQSDHFWDFYNSNTNPPGYLRFDGAFSRIELNSSGEFGVTSGSNTSSNIQDSLTAEVDYKFLANLSIPDPWPSEARPRDAYEFGLLASPAGFEWNREFSLGNYTPKVAFGGAIPYIDYPAKLWSHYFNITGNPGFPPTLFTGFTYVNALTGKTNNPAISAVHDRWDTEFIYDFPIARSLSLRATWNSYVGLDHPLWAHYYQIGAVYYIGNTGKGGHGLFFGYASGSQPPSYTKTGSWRLGYSVQF